MSFRNLGLVTTWNINPEIFSAGPITVRWYGLLFAFGFLIGYRIMKLIFNSENVSERYLDPLLMYMIVGTIIGARLGHCLFYEPEIYLADPIRILKVWEGGLASHGGVIGNLISIYFYVRRYPEFSFLWILDRVSIPTALAAGFIRLGNLFNSEIIGRPTNSGWGVIFSRVDGIPRHPTQIYESIFYFCTFWVLFNLYKVKTVREAKGRLFGIFLCMIFAWRLFVEFFKENQVSFEQGMKLNLGQLLSIPLIIAGILLILKSRRRSA